MDASKDGRNNKSLASFHSTRPSSARSRQPCGRLDLCFHPIPAAPLVLISDAYRCHATVSLSPFRNTSELALQLNATARTHLGTMEEKKKPTWGVTASISEAPPTPADNKLNEELVESLTQQNTFETVEGNNRRTEVLAHVQKVVEEFVRRAGKLKGIAQSTLDVAGGKIFFFGSYALGVHGPKSDIDTLIVVPKFVFLEDFFKYFPTIFRELSSADDITELVPVEEAFVPIIKMEYREVSLDLLFASMPTMSSVPKDMVTVDRAVLRHLDETTIRSVNGTRVVKELLASVPQPRSFRYALRAIKLWANSTSSDRTCNSADC